MNLPTISYPELNKDIDIEVDVVIVGSGAGGATIAAELSQAGLNVVIVEEGGKTSRKDFQVKATHRLFRHYRDNGIYATFGNPIIPVSMGKGGGGTTVINAGT